MMLRGGLGVGLSVMLMSAASQADETIPQSEVPAVVMSACKAKYPKAEIMKVELDKEDGRQVYEFKLREENRRWAAKFDTDGNFMKEEYEWNWP